MGKDALSKDGSYWLHGLQKEEEVTAPLELLEGHTLIVGSTGVGKTRLFDLMIGQNILRGGPVVIIDPKVVGAYRQCAKDLLDTAIERSRIPVSPSGKSGCWIRSETGIAKPSLPPVYLH